MHIVYNLKKQEKHGNSHAFLTSNQNRIWKRQIRARIPGNQLLIHWVNPNVVKCNPTVLWKRNEMTNPLQLFAKGINRSILYTEVYLCDWCLQREPIAVHVFHFDPIRGPFQVPIYVETVLVNQDFLVLGGPHRSVFREGIHDKLLCLLTGSCYYSICPSQLRFCNFLHKMFLSDWR